MLLLEGSQIGSFRHCQPIRLSEHEKGELTRGIGRRRGGCSLLTWRTQALALVPARRRAVAQDSYRCAHRIH